MRFALPLLVLCPVLAAQQSVQLPAPTSYNQNSSNSIMFFGTTSTRIKNEAHGQAIYDVNDIPVAGAVFKSLQVRVPTKRFKASNRATRVDLTVVMSVSPNTFSRASRTFASNHGTNKATVFSGTVSLPPRRGGSFPAPWEAPIPFSKVFPFAKAMGKSLVIETLAKNNTAKRTWLIEGNAIDNGTRTTVRSSCNFGAGGRNNSISHRNPTVGGSFLVNYNNYPKNTSSFNSSVHVWGTRSSGQWAGFSLPILFSTLGLNVKDRSCALATDVAATSGLNYDASRGRLTMSSVPVPNDPNLLDQCYITQAISLDGSAGSPGVHGSWASKWCIRSGKSSPARYVWRQGDNANASGFGPSTSLVPTYRLNQ